MNIVIMVAQLLLSLTILVFVHELGHFLAAKYFKTRVERFYLFFDFLFPMPSVLNFALWKKKIGETEYGFGWFPLGGYVSIAGMVDETQDADQLASEPQPWEYRSKRSWQKMIIILGGIIFNLIFAVMIGTALIKFVEVNYVPANTLKSGDVTFSESGLKLGFKQGDIIKSVNGELPSRINDIVPVNVILNGGVFRIEREENGATIQKDIQLPKNLFKTLKEPLLYATYSSLAVKKVEEGSNAWNAGLKKSDVIEKINGQEVVSFEQFKLILDSNKNKSVSLEVAHGKALRELKVQVNDKGAIGFYPKVIFDNEKYTTTNYSLLDAAKYGTLQSLSIFGLMYESIKKLFGGHVKAKDSVGGPIAMAKGFGSNWDWIHFWEFTAMISVMLAFMNLLPIPGLDGGHALIITYEAITRRPVNPKVLEILQTVGTYLILALMVFAFYNDISKIINK